MFVTVEGFNKTGLPAVFWNVVEPHARIDNPSGISVLAAVVMLLSNIASNVPTGGDHYMICTYVYIMYSVHSKKRVKITKHMGDI